MSAAYTVKESGEAEGHDAPLAVWMRNFPNTDFHKRYDWYYLNNPCRVFSYLLIDRNTRAIGAAGLSARRVVLDQRPCLAGVCSDFSVDAGNRFLNPALHLQRAVLAKGLERFPMLYGFPNARAAVVMNRVGYRTLGSLPNYTFPLRSGQYLAHRPAMPRWVTRFIDHALRAWLRAIKRLAPAGVVMEELTAVDARFDELWNAAAKTRVMAVRDAAYLDWRYMRHPVDRFRMFALRSRPEKLLGYAVVKIDAGGHWRLFDFLVRPGRRLLPALLVLLLARAADEGANSLTLEFFGPAPVRRALWLLGFLTRPDRRRIVVAGDAKTRKSGWFTDQASWYVTSGDED